MKIDINELLQNVNIIDYISNYAILEKNGEDFWCCSPLNPNDETPSFSVNEEKQLFYCFSTGVGGNVINFIMEYEKTTFKKALEKLCSFLNFDITNLKKPSSFFSVAKRFDYEYVEKFFVPNKFKDDIMSKYTKKPIKEWLEEGISQEVMDEFLVRYDLSDNRIVFPIWDNIGNIISISGRTLDPLHKEKKIRKYTYYGAINTTYFFYGFWQSKDFIFEKDEIIIFEGVKSKYKANDYGFKNSVASMTDRLSPQQISELIKIKVKDVVVCWDKDVSLTDINKKIGLLKNFKNIYVVIDTFDLLHEKDSPVDKGKEIFLKLYQNKIRLR